VEALLTEGGDTVLKHTTPKYRYYFIVFVLFTGFIILTSCGGSGINDLLPGFGSHKPQITGLSSYPQTIVQNDGGGQAAVNFSFSFSDEGGDLSSLYLTVSDASGRQVFSASDQVHGASGVKSGLITGGFYADTTQFGHYTIEIYVKDEAGEYSNHLISTFDITPQLVSIAVTPINPNVAKGITLQFKAVGTYADSSTQDLTNQVTWSTSDGSKVLISYKGLATGMSIGQATITAVLGSLSDSSLVTVTQAELVFIAIDPVNIGIFNGTSQQMKARGTFTDGTMQDITATVTWSSTNPNVATISNVPGSNGIATAVASGMTTITASYGSISNTATLTVSKWTLGNSGTTGALYDVAWSGTRFVVVGPSGFVLTSSDGAAWIQQASGGASVFDGIVWSGTQFVGAVWNGIFTSPDGLTWTAQSPTSAFSDLTWSGTQFVAVGGTILTSPDGIVWTSRISNTTQPLYSVTWSGTQFVATGYGGTILTSPDGITWTPQSSGSVEVLTGVAWSGSQFVVVGWGVTGVVLTSSDGVHWTRQTLGSALQDVAWCNSQFVAVGGYGAGEIFTSPNGVTWTQQDFGTTNPLPPFLYSVACFNNRFITVGHRGIILLSPE